MSVATATTLRLTPPPDPLERVLARYPAATPELLGQRGLQSRVDSKFVVPVAALDGLLAQVERDYAVLRVERGSIASYESRYFDSAELRCFNDHRRGRRIRHKVRVRHYPDRRLSFLEVKTKRNEAVTDKHRLEVAYGDERLGPDQLAFLRTHVGDLADQLTPQMSILYRRTCLIGLGSEERATIDLDLSVEEDHAGVVARALGHLAVIEIKQRSYDVRTPIMRAVKGAGHRLMSLSKYTTAVALMRPELGRNRLLPILRSLERI